MASRVNRRITIINGIRTETFQCEDCNQFFPITNMVPILGVVKGQTVESMACASCDAAFVSARV